MRPELIRRMASGFPLTFALLAIVLFTPFQLMPLVICLVLSLAGWEWAGLLRRPPLQGVLAFVTGFALSLLTLRLLPELRPAVLAAAVFIWLVIAARLAGIERRGKLPARPPAMASFAQGIVILVMAAIGAESLLLLPATALNWQLPESMGFSPAVFGGADQLLGRILLIAVLTLGAFADMGAYFAGKAWGRRKIAPAVSPGKTVAGLLGGLAAAVGLLALLLLIFRPAQWPLLLLPALLGVPVGLVGDLWVSLRKRYSQVKDSGRLLAGHGGMLDRADSHLAVLPMVALSLYLLGAAAAAAGL